MLEQNWPSPDLARLKGISRKTWYENQLRQTTLAALVAELSAAGVAPLLLRGAIPLVSVARPAAARINSDMACAVLPELALSALDALSGSGWRTAIPAARLKRHWPHLSSVDLLSPAGSDVIQLTWRLPWSDPAGEALTSLTRRAQPVVVAGQTARLPLPTDQLWLACLDGVMWQAEPDWRWLLDAAQLVGNEDVQWGQLLGVCRETATVLPIRAALDFLAQSLGVPVPAAALAELQATPVTAEETRRFELFSRRQGRLGTVRRRWLEYAGRATGRTSLAGFVHYLEVAWSLGSSREVLMQAAQRGWNLPPGPHEK
jgi:hypothetical protein